MQVRDALCIILLQFCMDALRKKCDMNGNQLKWNQCSPLYIWHCNNKSKLQLYQIPRVFFTCLINDYVWLVDMIVSCWRFLPNANHVCRGHRGHYAHSELIIFVWYHFWHTVNPWQKHEISYCIPNFASKKNKWLGGGRGGISVTASWEGAVARDGTCLLQEGYATTHGTRSGRVRCVASIWQQKFVYVVKLKQYYI